MGIGQEIWKRLESEPLAKPIRARFLNGKELFAITHISKPVQMFIGHPSCYHHLKEVFNKTKALSLPPHRLYDCAIDLIPGSTIPKGHLYTISGPEKKTMNDYITASLEAGFICPSSSPAGAGFFFVDKKDGSLCPCIDYSPLNDISIKKRYPLPLMTSVFDQLQQAKVFTKLNLRNAYYLIGIKEGDEWKTGFNTPNGHYEYRVMPFGLTNAPAVFQAMINDVLIYSPDLATHQDYANQFLRDCWLIICTSKQKKVCFMLNLSRSWASL